ncbi:MAG TPA: hypothetical protein VMD78_13370 [Candidatus Baltobacteraceae bacterium]|nr:hypothetical protein [Candidatus Baltobacteraceae bacterium]
MKLSEIGMQRLLRISSALIVLGLLLEIISLLWFHPLAFALFAFVATGLIALGVVVYLASLVFAVAPPAGK